MGVSLGNIQSQARSWKPGIGSNLQDRNPAAPTDTAAGHSGDEIRRCVLSEEIISAVHLITEVQGRVQIPGLAEQTSAFPQLPSHTSNTTCPTREAGSPPPVSASTSGPSLLGLIPGIVAPGTGLAEKDCTGLRAWRPSTHMATAQHKMASQVLLMKEEVTKIQLTTW